MTPNGEASFARGPDGDKVLAVVGKPEHDFRDEQKTIAHQVPVPAEVRRAKKPFLLEQLEGPGSPRQFVLESNETVVGRSLQAAISINSGSISRQHLVLKRAGPEFTFTDMNSSNGVYLNGVKTHSAVLRDGDTVQLGDVVLVFHEGS